MKRPGLVEVWAQETAKEDDGKHDDTVEQNN